MLAYSLHTPQPMHLLKYLPDPVHDILAHFVILPELTADTDIKSILKTWNLVLVQVGDDGLFLQGHVSQDITDNLVYVGWVDHNFSAGELNIPASVKFISIS